MVQQDSTLVGGFKHFLFSIIYGIILPIDELIFFKMVIAPPTRISCVNFAVPGLWHPAQPVRLVREQTANCIKDLNALRTEVMRAAGYPYLNDLGEPHRVHNMQLVFAGAFENVTSPVTAFEYLCLKPWQTSMLYFLLYICFSSLHKYGVLMRDPCLYRSDLLYKQSLSNLLHLCIPKFKNQLALECFISQLC